MVILQLQHPFPLEQLLSLRRASVSCPILAAKNKLRRLVLNMSATPPAVTLLIAIAFSGNGFVGQRMHHDS